jgi:hypothetical protein
MQALEIGSDKPAKNWCWWSTTESIQREVPCVTAIIETLIAVPLYWWIALQVGTLPSLLIGVAVAPLVLLRSEESVALGIRWFLAYEKAIVRDITYNDLSGNNRWLLWTLPLICFFISAIIIFDILDVSVFYPNDLLGTIWISLSIGIVLAFLLTVPLLISVTIVIPPLSPAFHIYGVFIGNRSYFIETCFILLMIPGYMIGVLVVTIGIRIAATIIHLQSGIRSLPRNFRRLAVCTSPVQIPEIIPGIETTDSQYRFREALDIFTGHYDLRDYIALLPLGFSVAILYLPAWLYRLTIKSTAWFWWPLAFLGDELGQARNPKVLSLKVRDSLWARTRFALACLMLLVFVGTNLILSGVIFQENPLLTPIGYMLLIDWMLQPWQVCSIAGAVLSVILIFMLDHALKEHKIAQEDSNPELMHAAERKFGWIERLSRLRLLLFIIFWLMVGAHAILYFNSQRCWFSVPPNVQDWAKSLYGDHLPPDSCLDRLPKPSL